MSLEYGCNFKDGSATCKYRSNILKARRQHWQRALAAQLCLVSTVNFKDQMPDAEQEGKYKVRT